MQPRAEKCKCGFEIKSDSQGTEVIFIIDKKTSFFNRIT
jgi:hypothetical protein